jgi:hypothetical protein
MTPVLVAHLCGWCPKPFNPPRLVNGCISHGLCARHAAQLLAEIDALDQQRRLKGVA